MPFFSSLGLCDRKHVSAENVRLRNMRKWESRNAANLSDCQGHFLPPTWILTIRAVCRGDTNESANLYAGCEVPRFACSPIQNTLSTCDHLASETEALPCRYTACAQCMCRLEESRSPKGLATCSGNIGCVCVYTFALIGPRG